jgi:DMSO/TMAO reductase YedYZ molybdopterin-dependent catalytic subunit
MVRADVASNYNSGWTLTVNGAVYNVLTLSVNDLATMERTTEYAEIFCYGNPVVQGYWSGVRLGFVLEQAGFDLQQADSVVFNAQDGYTITLPIAEAMREDVIVAYERDGVPLIETLRLVVPGANGNVWISMINRITVNQPTWVYNPEPGVPNSEPSPTTQSSSVTPQEPSISRSLPAPQPVPSIQPVPESQHANQSVAQPAVLPSNSQPVSQKDGLDSDLPLGFEYALVVVVAVGFVAGCVYLKRRK